MDETEANGSCKLLAQVNGMPYNQLCRLYKTTIVVTLMGYQPEKHNY